MLISHGASFGGGAEVVFDELVGTLLSERPDVELLVVTPGEGTISERARRRGAGVVVIAQPRWADFGPCGLRYWAHKLMLSGVAFWQTRRAIRSWRPDAVVANTMTIPVGPLAARTTRVRVIWMINEFGQRDHDLVFLFGYRRTLRWIGRIAAAVVCCSQAVSDEMAAQGVPPAKLMVGYCAMNTPRGGPNAVREPRSPLNALVVGRLSCPKGQLMAVLAVGAAQAAGAEVDLRLVGAAYDPAYVAEIEQAIRDADLTGRVHLVGALDDPYSEYRRAHVFLMCSRDEAFGRVTVEAMRMGLPVIGVNRGGTAELIEHGRNGFLVDPGDVRTMGKCLVTLWDDESLRSELGQTAQESATSRFTPSAWAQTVLAAASS
jgi:glycosyltransferase involved in cell wall biosynthesis